MFYYYDRFGWYANTFETNEERTTDKKPDNMSLTVTDGELRANWTGYEWKDMPYRTPAPEELNPTIVEDNSNIINT